MRFTFNAYFMPANAPPRTMRASVSSIIRTTLSHIYIFALYASHTRLSVSSSPFVIRMGNNTCLARAFACVFLCTFNTHTTRSERSGDCRLCNFICNTTPQNRGHDDDGVIHGMRGTTIHQKTDKVQWHTPHICCSSSPRKLHTYS